MIWEFLKLEANLIDYIANELLNSRLSLFIGSGISLSFKISTWDNLVKNVCSVSGVPYSDTEDKYVLMNYCKARLGEKYISEVKKALYQDYTPVLNEIASNDLLVSLGAMIIGSKRGKVNKVITYNYDDILETYLLYHGYMPNTITNVPYVKIDSDIDIYHPHGYLPSYWGTDSERIILDQDSYSAVGGISNPFYREIEGSVLSSTCLLIGISGRDRGLNDLLVQSFSNHISRVVPKKVLGFIFKLESELMPGEEESFKAKGIFCIKIKSHNEIPSFISHICNQALRVKYKDYIK
jgi:hypothetical protein